MPAPLTRERLLEVLGTVPDPEVPVISVVELGIVRDVASADDGRVTVTITPTYSGCPAMLEIEKDIRAALAAAVPCPWCGSSDTEMRSEFGSTACKAIHVCRSCRQPFDEFKPL